MDNRIEEPIMNLTWLNKNLGLIEKNVDKLRKNPDVNEALLDNISGVCNLIKENILFVENSGDISVSYKELIETAEHNKYGFITKKDLFSKTLDGIPFVTVGEQRDTTIRNSVNDRRVFISTAIKKCNGSKRVLDLGCGQGHLLRNIKEVFPTIKCYGIDTNKSSLVSAKERVPDGIFFDHSIADTRLLKDFCKKYLKLDAPENYFDVVMLHQVLEHLDPNELAQTLYNAFTLAKKCVLVSVPSISALPYLAYYHMVPEQVIFNSHKLFFTEKLLQHQLSRILNKHSFPSYTIEVVPYLQFAGSLKVGLYYHLMGVVEFKQEDSI